MSLFVDRMKCRLCGQPMTSDQILRKFLPFVANEMDALRVFNDGVFHESCVEDHPLSQTAIRLNDLAIDNGRPEMRCSSISGKPIVDYADYLPSGLLTSDPSNPLYEFNFMHFSKVELGSWHRLDELVEMLVRQEKDGRVAGKGIDWLISELTS